MEDGTGEGALWVEHLDEATCWQLLSAEATGRIGVLVDSAPEIYVVNHVVDEGTIVFRTDAGSKLHGLLKTPAVCYQVDGVDAARLTGWSVLVKGRATELAGGDLELAHRLDLRFWGVGDKTHYVRIVPAEVTGRRIHRG